MAAGNEGEGEGEGEEGYLFAQVHLRCNHKRPLMISIRYLVLGEIEF